MKRILSLLSTSILSSSLATVGVEQLKSTAKAENSVVIDITSTSGRDSKPFPTNNEGLVNDSVIKIDISQYANNWTEFLSKYPHFKFLNSTISVGFDNRNSSVILDNEGSYSTVDFDQGDEMKTFIDNKIIRTNSEEFVSLSVIGMKENNVLSFGIYYSFHLVLDHSNPVPYYESNVKELIFCQ